MINIKYGGYDDGVGGGGDISQQFSS